MGSWESPAPYLIHKEETAGPRRVDTQGQSGGTKHPAISQSVEEGSPTLLMPQARNICLHAQDPQGLRSGRDHQAIQNTSHPRCRASLSLFKIEEAPDHLSLSPSRVIKPNSGRKKRRSCKHLSVQGAMRHLVSSQEGLWLQDLVKEGLLSTRSAPGSDTQHLSTPLRKVCAALFQRRKRRCRGVK